MAAIKTWCAAVLTCALALHAVGQDLDLSDVLDDPTSKTSFSGVNTPTEAPVKREPKPISGFDDLELLDSLDPDFRNDRNKKGAVGQDLDLSDVLDDPTSKTSFSGVNTPTEAPVKREPKPISGFDDLELLDSLDPDFRNDRNKKGAVGQDLDLSDVLDDPTSKTSFSGVNTPTEAPVKREPKPISGFDDLELLDSLDPDFRNDRNKKGAVGQDLDLSDVLDDPTSKTSFSGVNTPTEAPVKREPKPISGFDDLELLDSLDPDFRNDRNKKGAVGQDLDLSDVLDDPTSKTSFSGVNTPTEAPVKREPKPISGFDDLELLDSLDPDFRNDRNKKGAVGQDLDLSDVLDDPTSKTSFSGVNTPTEAPVKREPKPISGFDDLELLDSLDPDFRNDRNKKGAVGQDLDLSDVLDDPTSKTSFSGVNTPTEAPVKREPKPISGFDDLELLDSLDPDFRNDRNKKGAVGQDLDLSDVLDDPTSKTSFSGVNTPTEAPVKREPKPISGFDDLELLDSLDPDFRNDRNKKGAVGQDLDLSDVLDDPTSKTSFSGVNTPTEAPVKREPKPISGFDDLELLDSLDPDFRNDRNKKGAVGQDLDLSDVLDDPTSKTSFSGVNTPTEAPVKREPKPISGFDDLELLDSLDPDFRNDRNKKGAVGQDLDLSDVLDDPTSKTSFSGVNTPTEAPVKREPKPISGFDDLDLPDALGPHFRNDRSKRGASDDLDLFDALDPDNDIRNDRNKKGGFSDVKTTTKAPVKPKPKQVSGSDDLDLFDALDPDNDIRNDRNKKGGFSDVKTTTKAPVKPKPTPVSGSDDLDLFDALDPDNDIRNDRNKKGGFSDVKTTTKAPVKPKPTPVSGSDDLDLFDALDPDDDFRNDQNKNGDTTAESSTIAGIASAVVMALMGAVGSYVSYQKKKFCFSLQQSLNGEYVKAEGPESVVSQEPPVQQTLLQPPNAEPPNRL